MTEGQALAGGPLTGMKRLSPTELIHSGAHGQDHHPHEEGAHERHTDGRRPQRPEA